MAVNFYFCVMKRVLFLCLVLLLFTSCSSLGSESIVFSNVLFGFTIGGFLGYLYVKAPNFDYTAPIPNRKILILSILVGGIVGAWLMYELGVSYLEHSIVR